MSEALETGGWYRMERGLIAVWGNEAVQFLDGMITNDMKTLGDGEQMLAAFPNAQGRLLAVVRVLRQGERYLIETEEATREKVFQNLFRFTFAGDFFVEDLSDRYRYVVFFGREKSSPPYEGAVAAFRGRGGSRGVFFEEEGSTTDLPDAAEVSDERYETLRIEAGIPKYGIDMDETTVVSELGIDGLISYNKGCYIGQEIIARIYFRGHVAKQLTGLIFDSSQTALPSGELSTLDGKPAGRVTSSTFSPSIGRPIALGYVRYEHLAPGTKLLCGDTECEVAELPFKKDLQVSAA